MVIAGQDQLLAGSSSITDACVANAMTHCGVSLEAAIDMAGRIPARLFGLEEIRLARGSRADLVLFRLGPESRNLQVLGTLASGVTRFGGGSIG
jgi:N-acetylglucosamine-6-phosphate deacetylase